MKKVMLAIDESEESFLALQWLLGNLSMLDIDQEESTTKSLAIIHVVEPFPTYVYPGLQGTYPVFPATSIVQSVDKVQQENAKSILANAAHLCARARVKVDTSILRGDPKEMICEAAEQMQADLVVVGSRGLGAIKRAFLGSVSDYVVHHAKCPVLIVKPPEASQQRN